MGRTRTVGIRELRNRLSATIARVRTGDTVVVTDRGEKVALIVPAAARAETTELLRALVSSGKISWGGGKPRGLRRGVIVRGRSVADAVVEDRR